MLPDTPHFHDDWPLFLVCQSSPHILNRASLLTQRSNEKHAHSICSLIFRQPWQKQPLLCKIVENELKRQIFFPTKSILLSYRFLLRVINKWYGFKLFWLFDLGLFLDVIVRQARKRSVWLLSKTLTHFICICADVQTPRCFSQGKIEAVETILTGGSIRFAKIVRNYKQIIL